jgi:RNA polymerase sigma-70 factor (ECF subfamily)
MGSRANANEHLLHERLAAGDDDALAEVYDVYAPLVFGIARKVTASRALAEDVTQEVFVQLWQDPRRFDPERGTLRSYLGVLAHRRAVDAVRRDTRRHAREEIAGTGSVAAPTSSWGQPETVVDREVAGQVRRAIDRLPPAQQEALRLAYYGGRTYRDVASVLGIPEGTAKSRLRSGLANLSELLVDEGVHGWM